MKLLDLAIKEKRWDIAAYCLTIGLLKALEKEQGVLALLRRVRQGQDTAELQRDLRKTAYNRSPDAQR